MRHLDRPHAFVLCKGDVAACLGLGFDGGWCGDDAKRAIRVSGPGRCA